MEQASFSISLSEIQQYHLPLSEHKRKLVYYIVYPQVYKCKCSVLKHKSTADSTSVCNLIFKHDNLNKFSSATTQSHQNAMHIPSDQG
jgi:predicted nucleic acid-binding protein